MASVRATSRVSPDQRDIREFLDHRLRQGCGRESSSSSESQPSAQRCQLCLIVLIVCVIVLPESLLCQQTTSAPGIFYPSFTNVALRKPVSLETSSSSGLTCGEPRGTKDAYCESRLDETSLTACFDSTCDTECLRGLPNYKAAYAITSGFDWGGGGGCILAVELRPPDAMSGGKTAHFTGTSQVADDCLMNLDVSQLATIIIMEYWSVTFTVWINSELDNRKGTVLEMRPSSPTGTPVLRVQLEADQLQLVSGQRVFTHANWRVSQRQWSHLAVMIYKDSINVYLNGSVLYPALHGVQLESNRLLGKTSVGKSLGLDDPFIGYMQDFRIYLDAVTNRGIQEIYNGTFDDTRIYPECRCPPEYPALKSSDEIFCVRNPGPDRPADEGFRISRQAHPIQYINDGKDDTAWISKMEINEAKVVVDLEDVFEVRQVTIKFYSPFPKLVSIESRVNSTATWRVWQHYSFDCMNEIGFESDQPLRNDDEFNCKSLLSPGEDFPYTRGVVQLDLLDGRPGNQGSTMTSGLRHFLQAKEIRVSMRGYHEKVSMPRHKYFGILEINVNATCDCHAHGVSCAMDSTPYTCECAPSTYTTGRQCDACINGTWRKQTDDVYAPDLCQACSCHTVGSKYPTQRCGDTESSCVCKDNVQGRACDTCKPGFYRLDSATPGGCSSCRCNTDGTRQASTACDADTGQCQCKANVQGRACDECKPGFSHLNATNPTGCLGCACNSAGSVNSSCNLRTGQCLCKRNVTGLSCDTCIDGTYGLRASSADGCVTCGCNLNTAINATCDQVSGQCFCRPHVTGRTCPGCEHGYYADSESDFRQNGCSKECDCLNTGSTVGTCQDVGGQCPCRTGVGGRRCQDCSDGYYGFGRLANNGGCLSCACDTRGTINGSATCDADSGQCRCKSSADSRTCGSCKAGHYGLNASVVSGCEDCRCSASGTQSKSTCDASTGQCRCKPGEGSVQEGGRQCNPYIKEFIPNYGPVSGGTKVMTDGGFLGAVANIKLFIGNVSAVIMNTSAPANLRWTSATIRPDHLDMIDREMPVRVLPASGQRVQAPAFTYKHDPVVERVQPLRTFLMGGINLTVDGTYLDSVAFPKMAVIMTHKSSGKSTTTPFGSNCTVESTNLMHCPTPEIILPDGVSVRRKRALQRVANLPRYRRGTVEEVQEEQGGGEESTDGRLNSDDLQFYLGLYLDGVVAYRNLSEALPDYGILRVYHNPQFEHFVEPFELKPFRLHWPFYETYFEIRGSRLTHGASPQDYRVEIGDSTCEDMEVSETVIVCEPPERQPKPGNHVHHKGAPAVVVSVGNIEVLVGYLRYRHSLWDYDPFRYGIIGSAAGLILLLVIVVIVCFARRYKKEPPNGQGLAPNRKSIIGAYDSKPHGPFDTVKMVTVGVSKGDLLAQLPLDVKLQLQGCIVDAKRLLVGKSIGEGNFGEVHVGRLKEVHSSTQVPVAIKTFKDTSSMSLEDTMQFIEEATLMREFVHENILGLVGVAFDMQKVFVLLPYMENGDLRSFITNEENMLTVGELIHFSLQISSGMNYLSKHHFVHRDLACRNCMVNKDLTVKIGDFGLSRDIYENDYYKVGDVKRPLPVKWMAIESLEKGVWDAKSDVWSFAVVLWELLTRGCMPYPDVDSFDVKSFILRGNRMDRPDYAPDEMYSLMLDCWVADPEKRPTFKMIEERISYFLNESGTMSVLRSKQGQQVPSIAFRGRSYLQLVG